MTDQLIERRSSRLLIPGEHVSLIYQKFRYCDIFLAVEGLAHDDPTVSDSLLSNVSSSSKEVSSTSRPQSVCLLYPKECVQVLSLAAESLYSTSLPSNWEVHKAQHVRAQAEIQM